MTPSAPHRCHQGRSASVATTASHLHDRGEASVPPARSSEVSALRRLIGLTLSLGLLAGLVPHGIAADTGVRVIVNPQVKGNQISRTALKQIFLKQAPKWGDGLPAQPVDQSLKSPVRSAFSNRLLGQPLIEAQIFWQKRMSQGVTPPPVKTSDEEVVAYVAQTPGAIGYVSSAVALPDTVRSLEVDN